MQILYRDINARDLREVTIADLLVNVEADIELLDDGRAVYSEPYFPVAELARELARWGSLGESSAPDFYFASLSFEDPGAVRILRDRSGWVVGSVFTPEVQSARLTWTEIAASIDDFIARVRRDVADLGFDPSFIGS